MIKVRDTSLNRGEKQVLSSIDADFPIDSLSVILGPNGAGKTSLLEVLTGQLAPQGGQIVWQKEPFKNWSAKKMAARRTVFSQRVQVNFPIQVADLVGMGNYAAGETISAREHQSMVRYALQEVEMFDFKDRSYPSLSGGEQQRVLLAKCIVQLESNYWRKTTQYLFLDEATASLDIKQKHQVMQLVKKIIRRREIGVVAIVHDLDLAATYADRIVLLKEGKIITQGATQAVLQPAQISETFDLNRSEVPSFLRLSPLPNIA